jgi:hypothetical protein
MISGTAARRPFTSSDLLALDAAIDSGEIQHWSLQRLSASLRALPLPQLRIFDRFLRFGYPPRVAISAVRSGIATLSRLRQSSFPQPALRRERSKKKKNSRTAPARAGAPANQAGIRTKDHP